MKNKEAILSFLRHLLTFAGGLVLANNPHIGESTVQTGIGLVLAGAGAAWGVGDEHAAAKKERARTGK
jgi:hypothetical protein